MSSEDDDDQRIVHLVERAVATGAVAGLPATTGQIGAAERRLGVRFDSSYRQLLLQCNGIEKLGNVDLYPVDELGASQRWLEWHLFGETEYFQMPEFHFETRGDDIVANTFHPAPEGRKHVLIGYNNLSPTGIVCNFSALDPTAPPGEVANCRYEPAHLGTIVDAIDEFVTAAEERLDEGSPTYASVRDQIHSLTYGLTTMTIAPVRYALSQRWRGDADEMEPVEAMDHIRKIVWPVGLYATLVSVDEPSAGDQIASAVFQEGEIQKRVGVGVTLENHVWRIDSWSWHDS